MKNVRVTLIRKYAEIIDGVDLSHHVVGETFRLPRNEARLLISEQWAIPAPREKAASKPVEQPRSVAADKPARPPSRAESANE